MEVYTDSKRCSRTVRVSEKLATIRIDRGLNEDVGNLLWDSISPLGNEIEDGRGRWTARVCLISSQPSHSTKLILFLPPSASPLILRSSMDSAELQVAELQSHRHLLRVSLLARNGQDGRRSGEELKS